MKNLNIKHAALAIAMGFFLSACGGGGGGGSTAPVTNMVPECGNDADLGKSVAADVTGKTIKKVGIGAEVRIWHSPDSKKSACMVTGKAEII